MKTGCILCGDVGSGKTRTALAYYYKEEGGDLCDGMKYVPMKDPRDLYIITTASVRDKKGWEKEMIPFLISTDPEVNLYSNKVVVDSWNNIGKYTDIENAFFIFDEQRVVGNGKWVRSFLKTTKKNDWILLSATPGDTWQDYIPVFVANGFYKNRTEFNNKHTIYKRAPYASYPIISGYMGTGILIKHRNDILVNLEDYRKTVPHHENIFVDYDISLYKQIVRTRWNYLKDSPIETASEYCQLLRRVVNTDESRVTKVLEIFEKHPRIILFYNYNYELDILRSVCWGDGVEVREWNGHKHEEIPTSDKWVYLVQYAAGAEGWNCITTDTIIFFSQNYSYKIMKQAAGRINRINTRFIDLYYYHLRTRSGIDNSIAHALEEKKKFNESKFFGGVKK